MTSDGQKTLQQFSKNKEDCTIWYNIEEDDDGYPQTKIYVEFKRNDQYIRKDIETYLKEEVNESIHECIRGNVLLATRYFNYRVKAFMNNIVMGGGNPMYVD